MKQKSRTTRLCDYNFDALALLNQLNLFMKLRRTRMSVLVKKHLLRILNLLRAGQRYIHT